MGKLFGTDGVRGIANKELTCELAYELGRAGGFVLAKTEKRPRVIIGRDTRISGQMIEAALVSGLCSVGVDSVSLGIIPTPGIAYLVRKYGVNAGVIISASHNPMEYNGIKFFSGDGYKLPDETEEEIEDIIINKKELPRPSGDGIGTLIYDGNALYDYLEFLKGIANSELNGFKIVLDCANGATFDIAPRLFRELGSEVIVINDRPDGLNINKNCGSTHPEALRKAVVENRANLGLAFDGDGDRLIAVDEMGNIVNGDNIMLICGLYLKEKGILKNNTIVATVMSNLGFEIALKEQGINVIRTKVGDRYVLEEMKKGDYILGGEQSGHIIFLNSSTTGDGLISALWLLNVLCEKKQRLSSLASIMREFPQVLVNVKVDNSKKKMYKEDEVIKMAISEMEKRYHGQGRILVRESGTEPLIRVMIEGEDYDQIKADAERLAKIIEERLG